MVDYDRVTGILTIVIILLISIILWIVGWKEMGIWSLFAGPIVGYAFRSITEKRVREQPSFSEDDRRKYRIAVRNDITRLVKEISIQRELLQHVVSEDWDREAPERRPLFFNPTEYRLIQAFYCKLDYCNEIVDNWSLEMKQKNKEFCLWLIQHCNNSGNKAIKEIVW